MKRQKGAALVIVLALLSGALMIGISGMNSALIDERLAGNFRAAALAQMNAERAASQGIAQQDSASWDDFESQDDNDGLSKYDFNSLSYVEFLKSSPVLWCGDKYNRCAYSYVTVSGVRYIFAMGAVESEQDNIVAQSLPIFIEFDSIGGGPLPPPFDSDDFDDAIGAFDKLGMLAGEKITIDPSGKYEFTGKLQANGEFEDNSKSNGKGGFNFKGDDSGSVGGENKEDVPNVDFDKVIKDVGDSQDAISCGDGCNVKLDGDQGGKTFFYNESIDLSGGFSNAIIVADGDIEIVGNIALKNVILISNNNITKKDDKDDFDIDSSFFFSKGIVDLNLKGKDAIDGLWIYSDENIDIDIKGGGDGEWLGGLIAKKNIKFDTSGSYNFEQAPASTAFSGGTGGTDDGGETDLTVVSWEG